MDKQEHIAALGNGIWLLVGSGESYSAEVVAGPALLEKVLETMFGTIEDSSPEEHEYWKATLEDPDEWSSDEDCGPTYFRQDIGEIDHLEIYRITEPLPAA